jgi:hypothetical protein
MAYQFHCSNKWLLLQGHYQTVQGHREKPQEEGGIEVRAQCST